MNIAIWGLGVSGRSALTYLAENHTAKLYAINRGDKKEWYDQVKDHISLENCLSESEVDSLLGKVDQIILSPGISPKNPALVKFSDVPKICEIELAYRNLKSLPPLIAVTGTNGKTSTVTLIGEALRAAGKKVFVGGNIGTPFCEIFKGDRYDAIVLELSSFQLELLDTFHPQVSCILNITPSHMERYDHFEDYENAKLNIKNNQVSGDLFIAPKKYQSDHCIYKEIVPIAGIDWSQSKLKGDHYKENFFVVAEVLNFLNIESHSILQNLVNHFPGVSLRLEYRGEFSGLEVYNDGKSTNTAATLSAINSFSDKEVTLVLGGQKRDAFQDWSLIRGLDQIKRVIAFGEAAGEIEQQLCDDYEVIKLDALTEEIKNYVIGNVLLFSPGYPSFDQFENYLKRGEYFNQLFS